MRKRHNLKLHTKYWDYVMSGIKNFEIRKMDRPYEVGDYIHFVKLNRDGNTVEEDKKNLFVINYILEDVPQFGLDPDYCILGIEKL